MAAPSESTLPQRHSVAWLMALIAIVAADLAALRSYLPLEIGIFWNSYPWSVLRERRFLPPHFPNLGLVVMILVLEVGLFRMVARPGRERKFWLGFEVAGWSCVIISSVFAGAIWWQARSFFEGYLLGRRIGLPLDMGRFVLFTSGLHLSALLPLAFFVGILTSSAWRRWGH